MESNPHWTTAEEARHHWLEQMRQMDAPAGCGYILVWWLGQQSWVIKMAGKTLWLDPFLSPMEARLVPPWAEPADLAGADYIIGSHDHVDHIDRDCWPAIAAAAPDAKLIVPKFHLPKLAEDLGIEESRFTGMDDRDVLVDKGRELRITAIAAAHESFLRDPETGAHAYLSFLLESEGMRIYFAADTVKYEGLEGRLRMLGGLDLGLLPINGRDGKRGRRGLLGNMTFQEAADLAGNVGMSAVIPAHYDMFAGNSADPEEFLDYLDLRYPRVKCILAPYVTPLKFPLPS